MYNYHADLIWAADKILLGASSALAAAVVFYTVFRTYLRMRRTHNLLNIKRNVHDLATSGRKPSDETCPAVDIKMAQEFLDVEMNRRAILFNENERQFIKQCFAAPNKIAALRKIAREVENKWRRIEALLSLGCAEDLPSLDIIRKALFDKDRDISYFSMLALGFIKDARSAEILFDFLRKNVLSASKIVSILETFPETIVDGAVKLTNDANPSVRFWAVKLMAKFREKRYAETIRELTKDASADVRAAACEYLGRAGASEAKEALLECLKDEAWYVRANAVTAASNALGGECIPDIINLINDKSLSVKENVKTALAEHIEAALPFVKKVLDADDEIAKKEVVEALEISGYIMKLFSNVLSEDSEERSGAIELLKVMITKAYAHFGLESALQKSEMNTRNKVLEIIKTIDRPFAVHIEKKLSQQINEL